MRVQLAACGSELRYHHADHTADEKADWSWRAMPLAWSNTTQQLVVRSPAAGNSPALCLGVGVAARLPHTCEQGSPSASLPFCDRHLPVEARVADLLARLDTAQKVQQWSIPVSRFVYNASLNLKAFLWDLTCIRGISPGSSQLEPLLNTTVFPHAIGLAASWDAGLVARVGTATALEGRILNALNYNLSGGTSWQGVSCDGGPLANTMHDPRWGRASETYGECPLLSAVLGVAATRALQNRSADLRWMAVSQVTRHYLGYHGANDLSNGGEEYIDFHSFADQQEPPYRSLAAESEGMMAAMSAFSIGARADWNTSLAPMTPSTVHPFLWSKLRDQWRSDCFVQTDCCDSITSMVTEHGFFPDIETAVEAALTAGLQASYGPNPAIDAALSDLLESGRVDASLLDTRISRTLLTRFRLGEFDAGNDPAYPYAGPYDVAALDGPAHRALAREAAAASVVLLRNEHGLLPLLNLSGWEPGNSTIAVIGPFANCGQLVGGYGTDESDAPLRCSYAHSYSGFMSSVSTILAAVTAEAVAAGVNVSYFQGSNLLTPLGPGSTGLDDAVAAARTARVVLLVCGLSTLVEMEGGDRANLTLPAAQQALVDAVAAATGAQKLILVIVSGGTVDTTYASADAAVQYFYPGEEAGTGLADVLFGRVSPSGRLPLTAYTQAYLSQIEPLSIFNLVSFGPQGVGRTYRYLNQSVAGSLAGSLVKYWFGFGLSYSTFAYSGLTVELVSPLPGPGAPATAPLATVSVWVGNLGPFPLAEEILQCYVAVPSNPAARARVGDAPIPRFGLQYFSKLLGLEAGAQPTLVQFSLPVAAFQTTTAGGERVVTGGEYTVYVSGHLPDDANGSPASNTLAANVQL